MGLKFRTFEKQFIKDVVNLETEMYHFYFKGFQIFPGIYIGMFNMRLKRRK